MDEVATFLDGGKLPCLLVENKADLLEEENAEKNPELEEFGSSNGFCGSFRTSAKTGLNIKSLLQIDPVTYEPDNCPLCKEGIPLVKPGSRTTVKAG